MQQPTPHATLASALAGAHNSAVCLLRRPTVTERTGFPESTLHRIVTEGLFTRPLKIGPNSTAWPSTEVNALVAARIAGLSDDAIRALVTRMHKARAGFAELATAGEDRG